MSGINIRIEQAQTQEGLVEDVHENWKKFQGSELGSLLAGIYGGTKPKIKYPNPKTNQSAPDINNSTWRAVSNKLGAIDPKKTTRRDTSHMFVPKVNGGRGRSTLALVDRIPQRRKEDVIKNEMEDMKQKMTAYRPARTHGARGVDEKDRLGQIFAFKGGKGLPEELTGVVQEAPFEREAKRKDNLINSKYKIVNGQKFKIEDLKGCETVAPAPLSTSDSNKDAIVDQILGEIDERREHLNELRGHLSQQQQDQLKLEIQSRLCELEKLK